MSPESNIQVEEARSKWNSHLVVYISVGIISAFQTWRISRGGLRILTILIRLDVFEASQTYTITVITRVCDK